MNENGSYRFNPAAALAAVSRSAGGGWQRGPGCGFASQAILIRADNGEAESVNHYLTDPALRASLQAFTASKWTNFQEITNLTVAIPSHETREVKMSDHCALQIRNLGGAQVAIDCISQGKQISRGTNSLPLIFGGSDTNQTAWFVSLRDANAPAAPAQSRTNSWGGRRPTNKSQRNSWAERQLCLSPTDRLVWEFVVQLPRRSVAPGCMTKIFILPRSPVSHTCASHTAGLPSLSPRLRGATVLKSKGN